MKENEQYQRQPTIQLNEKNKMTIKNRLGYLGFVMCDLLVVLCILMSSWTDISPFLDEGLFEKVNNDVMIFSFYAVAICPILTMVYQVIYIKISKNNYIQPYIKSYVCTNGLVSLCMMMLFTLGIASDISFIFGLIFTFTAIFMFLGIPKSSIIKSVISFVIALIMYIFHTVYLTRGVNFIPSEVNVLGTVGEVIGNYKIVFWDNCYTYFILYLIMSNYYIWRERIIGAYLPKETDKRTESHSEFYKKFIKVYKILVYFTSVVVCVLSYIGVTVYPINTWQYKYNKPSAGLLPVFIFLLISSALNAPEGYNREFYTSNFKQPQLYQEVATDVFPTTNNPNVIFICLEAFDNHYREFFEFNKSPTPFLDDLENNENTYTGEVVPNIEYGLTANTEYELISNLNTAQGISHSILVFESILNRDIRTNADMFGERGYSTYYLHPFYSSGYARNERVNNLGFQRKYFIEDMVGDNWDKAVNDIKNNKPQTTQQSAMKFNGDTLNADKFENIDSYRGFPSDKESFRKVVDVITNEDKPVYLFNMTVQNHGGWSLERDKEKGLDIDNLPIQIKPSIEEQYPGLSVDAYGDIKDEILSYANSMYQTDLAVKELYDRVQEMEEPTLVVICGDHSAGITECFSSLKQIGKYYSDPVTSRKLPFYAFSNYRIDNNKQMTFDKPFSVSLLPVKIFDLIGFDYSGDKTLEFLSELSKKVSIMTYDADIVDVDGDSISSEDLKNKIPEVDIYKGLHYYRLRDEEFSRVLNKPNS